MTGHGQLRRRGIATSLAKLAAGLEAQTAVQVPNGLPASVAQVVLTYPSPAAGATAAILMRAKLKLTLVTIVLLCAGVGWFAWRKRTAENDRLRQAAAWALPDNFARRPVASSRAGVFASPLSPNAPTTFQPIDNYADAGRSTPAGTVGHLYWAMNHRQIRDIQESIVFADADLKTIGTIFDQLSTRDKAVYSTPEAMAVAVWATMATRTVSGWRLDGTNDQPDGDAGIQFSIQGTNGIRHYNFGVRSFPDGWKVMLPPLFRSDQTIAYARKIAGKLAAAANP